MPVKNPEEIRNADTVEVDPQKLATKHSDEKFAFPKNKDEKDEEGMGSTDQEDSNTN
jgi:hypothetical protein